MDGSYALGAVGPRPALVDAAALYVTGEDHLRVTSFNGLAGAELVVEGRFVECAGRLVPFSERHVPASDRTAATTLVTLGEGWLCNLQVRASAGAPLQGQTFVVVELVRGRTGAIQPLACLLEGYVTATQRLAWPGSPIRASIEGRGFLRSFTGTDPAAGAEISETVPAGARWRLVAMSMPFITDATVVNRFPTLVIDDGANAYHESSVGAAAVASTTYRLTAGAFGVATAVTPLAYLIPTPADLLIPAGHRIRTATTGMVAGDNYGAPQMLVEEWIAG